MQEARDKQQSSMQPRLIEVLGTTQPLMLACAEVAVLRPLTLLSHEARRIGLRGLTEFKLQLKGEDGDTDVTRAALLRQANLLSLVLRLRSTGMQTETEYKVVKKSPCRDLMSQGFITSVQQRYVSLS